MSWAQIRKKESNNDPSQVSTELARSSAKTITREANSSSMPSSYQKSDTSSVRSGSVEEAASSEEEDDDEGEGYLYQGSSASFASAAGYNIRDSAGASPPTSSMPRPLPLGMSPYRNYNLSFSSNHSHQSSISSAACMSPTSKSPWTWHMMSSTNQSYDGFEEDEMGGNCAYYKHPDRLMGSLVREEGHIYSLAAANDLLYTGSDSKNIRVWRNQKEYSVFKANSGLVKSIVISGGDRIFTGHQDGKIRVWKVSLKTPTIHKKIATLPTLKAFIKSSMKPSNYVEASRKNQRNAPWIRHSDAISSLSLSEDKTLLYSASWDRTVKVWRVSNFKCLESISAHQDAVNAVVSGFDGLVFTGSADGTVKVWRREYQGKGTKHYFSQTLVKHECAVTALAVDPTSTILYSGSSDGLVNYWERGHLTDTGDELRAHKLAVLCLATAGKLVFTGSADMNICVWKREERTNHHIFLSMLTGHSGPVKCLAVGMQGEAHEEAGSRWILYSGSLDKSVKMWQVSEQTSAVEGSRRGGSIHWR